MVKPRRMFYLSVIVCLLSVLLSETGYAAGREKLMKQLDETMSEVRTTGKTADDQRNAAEHLYRLTRGKNSKKVDDKTIGDIASLLDVRDDSVRYWVAMCLGNFGPRARMAAPKLQALLAEVHCIQGSKTSASGIRFALVQMGVMPSPPTCEPQNGR
jgi:hypothetical protein